MAITHDKIRLMSPERLADIRQRISLLKKNILDEFNKYNIREDIQKQALQISKISRYYERFTSEKNNELQIRKKYISEQIRTPKNILKSTQEAIDHFALAQAIVAEEIEALERELKLKDSIILTENEKIYVLDEGKANLIGIGGAGKIKFGEDPETGELVAIKVQTVTSDVPEEESKQREEEAKIEKDVNLLKDRIIRTKKDNKADSQQVNKIYGIYEHLGFDLNYHLATSERLKKMDKGKKRKESEYIQDFNERLDIAQKMMEKIQEMHDQGIIHRDLKADNVMYNRKTKTVKIIDYGISKRVSKGTDAVTLSRNEYGGTPTHMTPELRNPPPKSKSPTDIYSNKTDLFSAGVTLMEIFGGEPIPGGFGKVTYKLPKINQNAFIKDDNPLIQTEKEKALKEIYQCIGRMVFNDKHAVKDIELCIGEKLNFDQNDVMITANDGYLRIQEIRKNLERNISETLERDNVTNKAISLIENTLGSDRLNSQKRYLFEKIPGYITDFYKIIDNYKSLKRISHLLTQKEKTESLALIKSSIEDFFQKNGFNFDFDVFKFGWNNFPLNVDLKSNEHLQLMMYFRAYLYTNLNFSDNGELSFKSGNRNEEFYHSAGLSILEKLKEFNFTPSIGLRARLKKLNEDDYREEIYDGVRAGSELSQALMGQIYLNHLTGILASNRPAAFNFPPGINEEIIINWIINARNEGNIEALSFIGHFADNYFNSIGAMYQSNVSSEQKARLKHLGEILLKISGDEVVNRFVNEITTIEIDNSETQIIKQFKEISNKAREYIVNDYSRAFLIDKEKIDKMLSHTNLQKAPNYNYAFSLLQTNELSGKINELNRTLEAERDRLTSQIKRKYFGNKNRTNRLNAIEIAINSLTRLQRESRLNANNKQFNTNYLIGSMAEILRQLDMNLKPLTKIGRFKSFFNRNFSAIFFSKTIKNVDPTMQKIRSGLTDIEKYIDPGSTARYQNLIQIILNSVKQGDIELIKSAAAQKSFDVNMKHSDSDGLLVSAIRQGKFEIFKFILSMKDVNLAIPGRRHDNAFTLAAKLGRVDILTELVLYAKNQKYNLKKLLNMRDSKGDTVLDSAILNGNVEVVKYLLSLDDLDVNLTDSINGTPLTNAVMAKRFDCVKLLVEDPRIEIEKPGYNNKTPMQLAAMSDMRSIIKLLEKNGATKVEIDVGLEQFAQESQSSHRDEVHASTAQAIIKLKERYPHIDIDTNLQDLKKFIDELASSENPLDSNMIAKRGLKRILELEANEKFTKTHIKEVLALTWEALNDQVVVVDVESVKRIFIKNLALTQREYNLNKEGIDDQKEDSPACNDGTINKLIETLDRMHPDVEIIYDAKGLAATLALEVTEKLFKKLDNESQIKIINKLDNLPLELNALPEDDFFIMLTRAIEKEIGDKFGIKPLQEDGLITIEDLNVIINNVRWIEFKVNEPKVAQESIQELAPTGFEIRREEATVNDALMIAEPNQMQKQAFNQIFKIKNKNIDVTLNYLHENMEYLNISEAQAHWFKLNSSNQIKSEESSKLTSGPAIVTGLNMSRLRNSESDQPPENEEPIRPKHQ